MEEDESVSIAPVQQEAFDEYLDWLCDAQPRGVTREALFEYYDDDYQHVYKIQINGETYPFTVFSRREWLGLNGTLDDFVNCAKGMKRTSHRPKRVKRLARELYMRNHEPGDETVSFPLKKLLWNGESVCISDYNGGVSFDVEHTDFYSYCSTGESMLREFYDALWSERASQTDDFSEIVDDLTQRDNIASDFSDFMSWGDHYHKIGPVCLLALKRPDGRHEVYYTKRSHYVLQAPDQYSVTPAGELQAETGKDVSMRREAIEVFAEEVLGVADEMSGARNASEELREVITGKVSSGVTEDDINITRTAFGYDMYAVKPIFAGLVYIGDVDTANWVRQRLNTNWEAEKLKRIVLPRSTLPKDMHPNVVCSSGALAFYEGIKALENQFGVDTGLNFTRKIQ